MGGVDERRRLAALHASGLLDGASEPAFDRLTRLTSRLLRTSVAAFTLIDEKHARVKSSVGLSLDPRSPHAVPLSESFCRLVLESSGPVQIEDARLDPRVRDQAAVTTHQAISYLGVPVTLVTGEIFGALCVVDHEPRRWSPDEVLTLEDLAISIAGEIELRSALRAVDRQSELLEAVLDSMGDGVIVLDVDGTFSHVNAAAERMLGPSQRSWTPTWARDARLFLSDGVTPVGTERDPLARAIRGTVSLNVDLVVQNENRHQGERRITVDAHPLRTHGGVVTAGVAVLRDTTRRRAAELALQASEERYRLLAEHASDLVQVLTVDRRVIYASPSSERLLGYTPDELLSLSRSPLFRSGTKDVLGPRFEAVQATGIGGEAVVHGMRTKAGVERWFETSLQPVSGSHGLGVSRVHSTSRDVTERIEAQQALTEREQRTRRLADATFEGISISHEGALIDGNAVFARLFGYDATEIVGMDIESFVLPDERDRHGDDQSQPEDAYRTIGRHKDGTRFPVEVRSSLIPWGNKTVRVTAIRDITARVAGEQAMRMHGEILGSMAEGVCLARIGDSSIVYANPRFAEMFGYQAAELNGLSVDVLQAPESYGAGALSVQIAAEADGRATFEALNVKKDGTPLWTRSTTSTMVHPDHGEVWVVVVEDITARRQEAEALQRQTGFVELLRGTATEANAAARSAEAMQLCLARVCAHMGWPFGHALAGDGSLLAATHEAGAGPELHVVGSVPVLVGPEVVAVLEFFSDLDPPEDEAVHAVLADIGLQVGRVVERERTQAALERHSAEVQALALIDELTGLRNRRGFMTLAAHQLRIASRTQRGALLFFADLNGMKRINDQLGHDAGDAAIRATADILRSSFRDADIIARLGGDEFVVYAPDADPDAIPMLRDRLAAQVASYNERDDNAFRLSVSLGVAIHDPSSPRTLDELLAEADSAMYEQKRKSGTSRAGS